MAVDKADHNFPKGFISKVNIIALLKFELAYYDVATNHVSHYSTGTPPPYFWLLCFNAIRFGNNQLRIITFFMI